MKHNYSGGLCSRRKKNGKYSRLSILFFFQGILLFACGPFQDTRTDEQYDFCPPVFEELKVESDNILTLLFNEPASIPVSGVSFHPGLSLQGISLHENEVKVSVSGQVPGLEYSLTATCEDNNGNSLYFIAAFHGFNSQIPGILINEFTPRGSSSHPDLIELKVTENGNMGGVVCYQGTYHNWDNRLIFPAFEVKKGDFIILHCKPQGISEEIDETDGKDISGGLDVSPHAYDFWIKDGTGLSGNNGVLTIYESPGAGIIDGVLYSDRTSESDDKYGGFGTRKVMERALELAGSGGWEPERKQIQPGDGINPEDSTATRSLCRDKKGTDTNTKNDWHIVPTRKSSFGEENYEEVWK
ncbi:MAG: hypothetical protein JXB88_08745 [Spirochaetales bacterium]|nr:hypothetical protein [Spirochaetales bacterium]